ncbi:MAG TPA: type II secretion system protein [Kofleriaceae bacterium]|jgi:prepilin-type N-terminal cleavage/methylation domain-containing protein
MTRTRNRQAGFTLLELMVTVAIIAVLAAIAIPSFAGESRKAKGDSEVAAFFGELVVREEQYAIENGRYLSTSTGESTTFPATPTARAQTLGTLPATWQSLKVRTPEGAARCGYVVIGGTRTDTAGTIARTTFNYTAPARNWFYVLAHCNLDGNSAVDSYYFASSDDARIQKSNAGR